MLKVSRSGYYDWCGRGESKRSREDKILLEEIRKVHESNKQAYGAVKTWRALRDGGVACGKHRVARLRRLAGDRGSSDEALSTGLPGTSECPADAESAQGPFWSRATGPDMGGGYRLHRHTVGVVPAFAACLRRLPRPLGINVNFS